MALDAPAAAFLARACPSLGRVRLAALVDAAETLGGKVTHPGAS